MTPYKLAESAAQFRRFLDAGHGSPEVRVVMRGMQRRILEALARLDEQANARY